MTTTLREPSISRRHLIALAAMLAGGLAGCATGPNPSVLIDEAPTAAGVPTVVYAVGNVSPLPAGAIKVARLMDVPWASLPPGADVRIAPGSQAGPITVTSRGTELQPITIHAAVESSPPVITSSVDFQNASHVKLRNVVVNGSPWAAVVIRKGSDHITVAQSTLQRSDMGVNITDGAGTGHVIRNNQVLDNRTNGIGVDLVNADPNDRTRIVGNTVLRSGHHGMEIQGSNYLIERNTTAFNGHAIHGTSGIHLFSRDATTNAGDGNIIRYNFSYSNIDRGASDGNGIQVDQWCDHNEVSFNVVWGNDGAGIIVFDGEGNSVFSNTAMGNGLDPGKTHGGLGEIIINSAGAQTNRTRGNQVYNNVLVATKANVPALYVDWITAHSNTNQIGANLYQHRAGGALLNWGNQLATASAQIDLLSGSRGAVVEAPRFANESAPLAHGLKLARTPAGRGAAIKARKDMQGTDPQPDDAFLGAYYTRPGL